MGAYVLLRIEQEDEAAALLGEMAANPHLPLTAPASGDLVHAEVVAEVDPSDVSAYDPTVGRGAGADPHLALAVAVRESYHRSGSLAAAASGGAA